MNEFPKNCTECEHTSTCQRCYGAIGCKYHEEITKAIVEQYEMEYGHEEKNLKFLPESSLKGE